MEHAFPSFTIAGVKVHALTREAWLGHIAQTIHARSTTIMVSNNLHSAYLYRYQPDLRKLQAEADIIRVDGIPFVFMGRLLGYPLRAEHRSGWMDLLDPFMSEAAQQGWRVFYLGSKPGVAAKGAEILRQRYPRLVIETHHGYFDITPNSKENQEVVAKINHFKPNVLMVGMGMPRQETWILHNKALVNTNVFVASGACIDYIAGTISTPPRWTGPLGLEWLYRLLSEPRRLWKRYLVEPWFVLGRFLPEFLNHIQDQVRSKTPQ